MPIAFFLKNNLLIYQYILALARRLHKERQINDAHSAIIKTGKYKGEKQWIISWITKSTKNLASAIFSWATLTRPKN
ncbi:MAG: hypothetical protein K1W05_11690, partial [Desulfovibrio sp.]